MDVIEIFITFCRFIFCMERVETGGLMSFDYSKAEKGKLSHKEKVEFEKAYEKYYERKKRKKRRKFIIILIVLLIVVSSALYFLY